jgi:phosphoribosylamine--glycine ligase
VRVLVIDNEGASGLDIALRAQEHGHDVKFSIRNPKRKGVGEGFVPRVDDPREWLRWSNLCICCDNAVYIEAIKQHRANGGIAIAATPETAAWEIDRKIGEEVFHKAGIPTIPSREFSDYDAAISFVKRTMGRYVSKPSGKFESDKSLSYVSSGPDDMVFMLERWKRLGKLKTNFVLQDHVAGIEMSASGWFGPGGWNEGWEESFEHKSLMNDNLGPATGEQGSILRYVRSSKLARKVLVPLTRQLERSGYVGDVSVNCIVDDKGQPWPLEFTTRLGWPAFNLQCALCEGDPIEWLSNLAEGLDSRCLMMDKVAAGVVVSMPDYPYSKRTPEELTGYPVYGLKPNLWKHWHPCEMANAVAPVNINNKVLSIPHPVTAGDYIGVMTAVADTVKEAALTVYRRLERLTIPGSPMYRTDIGKRLSRQLPKLQAMGYASNLVYSPQDSAQPQKRRLSA